jgi:hypothetical protein
MSLIVAPACVAICLAAAERLTVSFMLRVPWSVNFKSVT